MAEGDFTFFNAFIEDKGNGLHDFSTDAFAVGLLNAGYTFNPDNDRYWGDVNSNEIVAAGYSTWVVTNLTWTRNDASDLSSLDFDDPYWASIAATTIRHGILYNTTAANRMVGRWEINTNSDGGVFTIIIPGTGLFRQYGIVSP